MQQPVVQLALERKLEPLITSERDRKAYQVLTWTLLAVGLAGGGVVLYAVLRDARGWPLWKSVALATIVQLTIGLVGWLWASWVRRYARVDLRALARRVEREHPDLKCGLLAALEQTPSAEGTFGYLQERVINEAVDHAMQHNWLQRSFDPARKLARLGFQAAFLLVVLLAVWETKVIWKLHSERVAVAGNIQAGTEGPIQVKVTPGDAEVEQGGRLVVEAKFEGRLPAEAFVVVSDAKTGAETNRLPLKSTVDSHVFGGVISGIDKDATYQVQFEKGASAVYHINTFMFPALVQADAKITPPEYAALPVKEFKNIMSVSALEGSQIAFRLTVNKPLAQAELLGEDKSIVSLKPSSDDPKILEAVMSPQASQKYRVRLVDDRQRNNKQPPSIRVTVQANQPPKIEVTFPKRDLAVSPVQELPVEAKVWDDIGVQKIGAVFALGGKQTETLLTTDAVPGGKSTAVKTMFELEKAHAEPKQLVSYYIWADDVGPNAKPRRTMSDMFFAEVRSFEDIFRESEAPPGEGDPADDEKKDQVGKLLELQKQVVNATWRILRDTSSGKPLERAEKDVDTVRESEGIVKGKTEALTEKVKDADALSALKEAAKHMEATQNELSKVTETKTSDALNPALLEGRQALELLYRTQSREHKVMQMKRNMRGKGGGDDDKQMQVNQLELKQKDQRYEEEKEVKEQQTAEQKENLQVLNRLKELARRQEALAQKIKELETALKQAKNEEEKKEIERQLKRLQEEQVQLMRDLDELRDRMEKPENRSAMSEEHQKLDDAREQLRQATDKLQEQKLADAANAATRAQRTLEETRDEFRQRTAKKFADAMKQLKQEAGELAAGQEKLSEALDKAASAAGDSAKEQKTEDQLRKSMDQSKLAANVEEQSKALEKLLGDMRKISEDAEQSEPLLSNTLYDTIRRAQSTGTEDALADAKSQLQMGDHTSAQQSQRKAARGIEELKNGVDKAAESVLGSETEALRMARSELDKLIKEVNPNAAEGDQKPGEKKDGATMQKGSKGDDAKGLQPGKDGQPQIAQKGDKDGKSQPGQGKEGEKEGEGKEAEGQQPGKDDGKAQDKKAMAAGKEGAGKGENGKELSKDGKPGEGAPGASDEKGEKNSQALAQNASPSGQKPGQGQAQGKEGKDGKGEGQEQGQGQGKAQASNDGKARGAGGQRQQQAGDNREQAAAGNKGGKNGGGNGGWFYDDTPDPVANANTNPLTGDHYGEWSDRLRRVEEALDSPELRNGVTRIAEDARQIRVDYRRDKTSPRDAQIQARIAEPLAELRERVNEELAKRESKDSLAPVDRDPVPTRFKELVRRYYSELGSGR